jgi:prepilin-type N-terminal cleavage/methylation domain-containing protein
MEIKTKTLRGFTLIELLVVIAIISLLSSVVFASLNSARAKARDARRRSDLAQIQIALELYYDKYGTYQVSGGGSNGSGTGWLGYETEQGAYTYAVSRVLYDEGFLSVPIVEDPIESPSYMIYYCDFSNQVGPFGSDYGQVYALFASLENPTDEEEVFAQKSCNAPNVIAPYSKNYAVANKTY